MTLRIISFAAAAALLTVPSLAVAKAPVAKVSAPTVLASGTSYTDAKVGSGDAAVAGNTVFVHYTGWLYENGQRGPKFDSSRDRGEPFDFQLGAGNVIQGWDEGIVGMKPGGQRTLIIPPAAGYGDRGAGTDIPPGATLIFDVELIRIAG